MPNDFREQAGDVEERAQAADDLLARVIRPAETGAIAVGAEVRREALAACAYLARQKLAPRALLDEIMRQARLILAKYEPYLAKTATDATLAAWLEGGHGIVRRLPPPPAVPPSPLVKFLQDVPRPAVTMPRLKLRAEPHPFVRFPMLDAAAQDLARRRVMTADEFYRQDADARLQGFTVARVASLDALERIRDGLVEAVAEGRTLPEFRERVAEALDESALAPAHVETVFRTNMMHAYARGQKAVLAVPLVGGHFPFVETVPIHDSRLTELCRVVSASGLEDEAGRRTGFFWRLDPVWTAYGNPRHWNCRCATIATTLKRAARRGVAVARRWLDTGVQPSAADLCVPLPPVPLPAGWVSAWAA